MRDDASRNVDDWGLTHLRHYFVERYDVLKQLMTRKLGSADHAGDALHEAYVRLADKDALDRPVRSPQAFLCRVATNIAIDRMRSDARLLSGEEADRLLELQEAPDTADIAAASRNAEAVVQAMARLTERQRQILEAVRMDGVSQKELAKRYGISLRMVERELRKAHDFCVSQMRD